MVEHGRQFIDRFRAKILRNSREDPSLEGKNPQFDYHGYDRHWLIDTAAKMGPGPLKPTELPNAVIDWAAKAYPTTYEMKADRIGMIRDGWTRDNPTLAKANPTGWQALLDNEGWKRYVPPTDFPKK